MAVRAVRGATQLLADDRTELEAAVTELMQELMARNGLVGDDLISIIFTSTPDLTAGFPAAAARALGLADVPLLGAVEANVPTALPRVVRVMVHTETERSRAEISHVYLRGAEALRPDLTQEP